MPDSEVRVVDLEPMRVAAFRAVSHSPEAEALEKLRAWAEPRGLLGDLERHPVFGFDCAHPEPGEAYGYEFWIRIAPDVQVDGDVEVREFAGGRYAVKACVFAEESRSPGCFPSWDILHRWAQANGYTWGSHQHLEKAHDPFAGPEDLVLDLYFPLEG